MPAVEIGRICVKNAGRETGKRCVIVDVTDKSFVMVTGPKSLTGIKRRRVNLKHLTILEDKLDIKRGASDEDVAKVLKASGKIESTSEPKKSA